MLWYAGKARYWMTRSFWTDTLCHRQRHTWWVVWSDVARRHGCLFLLFAVYMESPCTKKNILNIISHEKVWNKIVMMKRTGCIGNYDQEKTTVLYVWSFTHTKERNEQLQWKRYQGRPRITYKIPSAWAQHGKMSISRHLPLARRLQSLINFYVLVFDLKISKSMTEANQRQKPLIN